MSQGLCLCIMILCPKAVWYNEVLRVQNGKYENADLENQTRSGMSECNICNITQNGTIIMQHGIRTMQNGNITIHHLSVNGIII